MSFGWWVKGRVLQNLFFWLWFLLRQLQLMPVTARKTTKPTHRHWSCSRLRCSTPNKNSNKKIPTDFLLVAFAVILVYSTKVIVCFFSVCYLDITLHPFMLLSFLFKSATLKLYMEVRFPAVLETVFHQKCRSMQVVQSHCWDYSLGSYRANLFWTTGWFAWKKHHREPVVIAVLRFVTENGAGCWILYLLFLTVLNSQVSCCYFM